MLCKLKKLNITVIDVPRVFDGRDRLTQNRTGTYDRYFTSLQSVPKPAGLA